MAKCKVCSSSAVDKYMFSNSYYTLIVVIRNDMNNINLLHGSCVWVVSPAKRGHSFNQTLTDLWVEWLKNPNQFPIGRLKELWKIKSICYYSSWKQEIRPCTEGIAANIFWSNKPIDMDNGQWHCKRCLDRWVHHVQRWTDRN